jgi:transposase-like protein
MTKERNRVSPEVRAKAIAEMKLGKPRKEVAAELHVSLAAVNLWMAKANAKPPAVLQAAVPATQGADDIDLDNNVEHLQLRIMQLEIDVKHLKSRLEMETKYLKEKLALYEHVSPD